MFSKKKLKSQYPSYAIKKKLKNDFCFENYPVLTSLLPTVKKMLKTRDGSHGEEHCVNVAKWAIRLVPEHHPFKKEIFAAALVHDCVDKKYVKNPEIVFDTGISPKLREKGSFSNRSIFLIRTVVLNLSCQQDLKHNGPPDVVKQDKNVFEIYKYVADSDRIEATGATGWMRTFMFLGHLDKNFKDAIKFVQKQQYFTEKAMFHSKAKEIARKRIKNMILIGKILDAEQNESKVSICYQKTAFV